MQFLGDTGNLILIVLGFGMLIAVHEFGHFIAARWAGIRVDAFAIGMGPAIFAFRRGIGVKFGSTQSEVVRRLGAVPEEISMQQFRAAGVSETEYGLRLLPIGGFVRMKGQEDLQAISTSTDPDAYGARPIWKRMVVVSAGVFMNLLLAILLYLVAFMVGVRFDSPTIGDAKPNGPAATAKNLDGGAAGLRVGDRITAIDGGEVNTFADVQIAAAMSKPGQSMLIAVARPGVADAMRFEATPTDDANARLRSLGIVPARDGEIVNDPLLAPLLVPALLRSGLTNAGVGPGWRLASVQGAPAATVESLQIACAASEGKRVATTWSGPNNASAEVTLTPDVQLQMLVPTDDQTLVEGGLLGLMPLTRIDWVRPGSPNDGTLQAGDVVLAVEGTQGPRVAQFRKLVRTHANSKISLHILRGGAEQQVPVRVDSNGRLDVLISAALDQPLMARPIDRVWVDNASQPTPAAALELAPLARIESVNGAAITDWRSLRAVLRLASANTSTSSTAQLQVVLWGADKAPRTVSMQISAENGKALQALGWSSPLPLETFDPFMTTLSAGGNPLRALAMGFHETSKLAVLTWLTLDRLARGSVPVDQLRGPVGIVHVGTRVADRGFMYLIFFLAMISVNLAVLNFLPLPIVDGGLFLFLAYEAVRGRPPSVRFQNAATMAGLVLIGSLFVVTFYNDVMRLVSGGG